MPQVCIISVIPPLPRRIAVSSVTDREEDMILKRFTGSKIIMIFVIFQNCDKCNMRMFFKISVFPLFILAY
jgi:hypothetical protein